jgi:RND superfamily putative drug exporter
VITTLARFCYRHRWWVLGAWVLLLVVLSGLNSAFGGTFRDEFSLPGSDSQDAQDLLEAHGFNDRAGFGGMVVVEDDAGFDDPAVRQQLDALFTEIQDEVPRSTVNSPFTAEGARQISADGTIAYAEVNLADRDNQGYEDAGTTVRDLVDGTDIPGTEIELAGDIFVEPQEFASEGIGLLAAMVVLLVAFGSVLAMGLPIVTALFGIGTGVALVGLTVNVINMPSFSNQAVTMIGIGVGIDYALFIVTRYRESLHEGLAPDRAVVRALDTAGRAVLFAGTTVIIAVLGLFTIGLDMMNGLAVGISVGVLMTMLAALTLLPAVLGFVGANIDKLRLPFLHQREGTDQRSFWYRWSRVIQRRPWRALIAGAAVLLVMAMPLLSMRLGTGDASNRSRSDTTRRAFDLLSEGFGEGFNGPFLLATELPGDTATDMAKLGELQATLQDTPGVAFATPPQPNADGTAAVMTVFPTTAPQDEATTQLVHTLRDDTIPSVLDGSGMQLLVGGLTPAIVDFSDYMADRLPWFIGTVLVLSFILLMAVFRSLLVPLKAVVMNLISIGAAYGILVAVFQWGWGASLIGVPEKGPVEMWIPMMLFAVVFGLSMDYEVFLLSRIREEYDRLHDNAVAVANGLASTARVITAAAVIMVFVFGAFILGDERAIKMFGLGLAAAVFLDATIVRMVLVPATMELLGDANWWLPRWLDRILPTIHVEASDHGEQPEPTGSAVDGSRRDHQPVS